MVDWRGILVALALVAVGALFLFRRRDPYLANLPGPDAPSRFWGEFGEELSVRVVDIHPRWIARHGKVFRYSHVLGKQNIVLADVGAAMHVLGDDARFGQLPISRGFMRRIMGDGIITADVPDHRRMRRIMSPAFSPGAIKGMMPMMHDAVGALVRRISDSLEHGRGEVDMMTEAFRTALDLLGSCGFDTPDLGNPNNALGEAFRDIVAPFDSLDALTGLQIVFPVLLHLPNKGAAKHHQGCAAVREMSRRLVEAGQADVDTGSDRRDLLSLVIRANSGESSQRLSNDEVDSLVMTALFAGHETTTAALTWALHRLAVHPEIQDRLRAEVLSVPADPDYDTLQSLPFLDAVVREVLRLDAPIPEDHREARVDTAVPLSSPIKGRDGRLIDTLHVKKGQALYIPLIAMNRSPELWGPDANEFNPDRFSRPHPTPDIPAPYNLLTFISGPRTCLGWRFAVAEIKVTLFALLRAFAFSPAPGVEITSRAIVGMRPYVKGQEEKGARLPMTVTALQAE